MFMQKYSLSFEVSVLTSSLTFDPAYQLSSLAVFSLSPNTYMKKKCNFAWNSFHFFVFL